MSLKCIRKHNRAATILIETRQITSNLEKANGLPGLRCFISTAWDLQHDRPINQCLSYGGTLANATLRSPEMLSKSFSEFNCNSSRCHLSRWYQYHGVRHEVSVIHNGYVWLRPIGSRTPAENAASRDAPPADHRPAERQAATPVKVRAQPDQDQFLLKSRASLPQQPSDIQRLVGHYAETMFHGTSTTKIELSRRMQLEIQVINLSRSSDDQLKIPSRKTLSLFIDEYFNFALSQGLAARRSIVKAFAGVSRKPLDRQTLHPVEQSPPALEQ